MKVSQVTPPLNLPVTLTEVKDHLRIESAFTTDDAYIQSLIHMATSQAESILRRKLVIQTWKYFLDAWPKDYFLILPFGSLQSVTSIKYKDSDAVEYTMDSGDYIVDADSDPGKIVLGYGKSWPSVTLLPASAIYTEFVCGFGGHVSQAITAATNASPIVATVTGHGYSTGDELVIEGVGGNTAANGRWIVTVIDADTFSLNGSVGNGAYTTGGTATEITVPEPIRHAIKMMVSESYENREETVMGVSVSKIKDSIINLLWTFRLFGV